MTSNEWLTSIANAIRQVKGSTLKIKASDFSNEISNLGTAVQLFTPSIAIDGNTMTITDKNGGFVDEYDIYVNELYCTTSTEKTGNLKDVYGVTTSGYITVKAKAQRFIDSEFSSPVNFNLLAVSLSSDGTYYSVTGIGNETGTVIIIPEQVDEIPVTTIGTEAFYKQKQITRVIIPDSVTTILDRAFHTSTYIVSTSTNSVLEYVLLGNSVSYIGVSAFAMNAKLKEITFPNSLKSIGRLAFSYCGLENLYIPASVTSIDSEAFISNKNLTNIEVDTLNSKYKSIDGVVYTKNGKRLLIYPSGKNENNGKLIIPETVEEIYFYSVAYNNNIKNVIIHDNVTNIYDSAFVGCKNLKNITIGSGVTKISKGAFYNCYYVDKIYYNGTVEQWLNVVIENYTSLPQRNWQSTGYGGELNYYFNNELVENLIIPSSITKINDYQFMGALSIKSVEFPDSLTSIGTRAFCNCLNLKTISIGSGLKTINGYAFYNCTSITEIYYNGTIEMWNLITKGSGWILSNINYTVHCTDGDITV